MKHSLRGADELFVLYVEEFIFLLKSGANYSFEGNDLNCFCTNIIHGGMNVVCVISDA